MARPERHDVDYFPFTVKDGRTLFILEHKYQCKGTGFFTNICRLLSTSPDHHFCIKDEADKMLLFAKTYCDEEAGMDMLEMMVKTGKLHRELWITSQVIASEDFLDSIKDAYKNRKNNIITISKICKKYGVVCITSDDNPQENEVSTVDKPQTKLKESKLKESIFKRENFLIDVLEIFYFKNWKNPHLIADDFFNHYEKVGWETTKKQPITDPLAAARYWKNQTTEGKNCTVSILKKWQIAYHLIKANSPDHYQYLLELRVIYRKDENCIVFKAPELTLKLITNNKAFAAVINQSIKTAFGKEQKYRTEAEE